MFEYEIAWDIIKCTYINKQLTTKEESLIVGKNLKMVKRDTHSIFEELNKDITKFMSQDIFNLENINMQFYFYNKRKSNKQAGIISNKKGNYVWLNSIDGSLSVFYKDIQTKMLSENNIKYLLLSENQVLDNVDGIFYFKKNILDELLECFMSNLYGRNILNFQGFKNIDNYSNRKIDCNFDVLSNKHGDMFDDEGTIIDKNYIIQGGIIENYICNQQNADLLQVEPVGVVDLDLNEGFAYGESIRNLTFEFQRRHTLKSELKREIISVRILNIWQTTLIVSIRITFIENLQLFSTVLKKVNILHLLNLIYEEEDDLYTIKLE